MSPVIHRSAPSDTAYLVPSPRVTDAIGEALRGAFHRGEGVPLDMTSAIAALDRIGRA